MTQEEIIIKITEYHKEIGSLKHRMDDCERSQEGLAALVRSVDRLAINMESMLREQQHQGERPGEVVERLDARRERSHEVLQQFSHGPPDSPALQTA